jgi:endoglucanase
MTLVWAVGCVAPAQTQPPAATAASAEPAAVSMAATETPKASAKPGEPAAPPLPPWKHGENIFAGPKLAWIDPYGPAHLKSKLTSKTDPPTSALFAKIADNGGAEWIGDWTPNVQNWVNRRATAILKTGALPLFLSYNIPKRDCGQYSAGGATAGDAYKQWITAFANGIGSQRAAVVLEPDSIGLLTKCLTPADQKERLELLHFAIHTFEALGNTAVYLDAGHSGWLKPAEDAKRLKEAGIEEADGFALNVSNYKSTSTEIEYGKAISKLLGGKHFVIDTSRNGNGAPPGGAGVNEWCNPPGRALGHPPTTNTGVAGVDAFLWVKYPGQSDGSCRAGEPPAGTWWPSYALSLVRDTH